ncbi:MAG: HEPN domain-containing protein [Vulcanimicrobiaceae bacterium]
MQRDRIATARVWLANAANDLELAGEIAERFAARACFHAQQCSELALKGALIALADDHPRTHVGAGLLRDLQALDVDVPSGIVEAANRLDLFYVGSRYPDALGGADPLKVLTADDARRAIAHAGDVLAFATQLVDRSA